MEKWKQPPIEKMYEALGTIADGRISVYGNTAKVFSSSGNKFYLVEYDPAKQALMSNDNTAYYTEYLSYPAVAFLLKAGVVDYDPVIAEELKGVHWKDLNTKFRGDFAKTVATVLETKSEEVRHKIVEQVTRIHEDLSNREFFLLGHKVKPPEGY
jgi:hypothetical protein